MSGWSQRVKHGALAMLNRSAYRTGSRQRRPAGRVYKRLAIVKLDGLGDFVLALGALRRLIKEYAAEQTVLVVSTWNQEIAALEFPKVERIVLPLLEPLLYRGRWRIRPSTHALFAQGVEDLVCLRHHRSPYEELICAAIPAARTLGSVNSRFAPTPEWGPPERLSFDVTPPSSAIPGSASCVDLVLHAALVAAVLNRPIDVPAILPSMTPPCSIIQPPVISLSPYGSSPIRDIPVATLLESCRAWQTSFGLPIRILAPPTNAERFERLLKSFVAAGLRQVALHVTQTIPDLIRALSESALTVATESGPAHLATALDRNLVGVLGGGHFGVFAPWRRSSNQAWVFHRVPCYHCNWHCHLPEPQCITHIPAASLTAAGVELLQRALSGETRSH